MDHCPSYFGPTFITLWLQRKLNERIEGVGYGSAEDAALAYAQALKTGSIPEILSTFAVESYVENYDMGEHLDYRGSYMLSYNPMIESNDEYSEAINMIYREYQIVQNLSYLYLNFSMGEKIPEVSTAVPTENVDEFMETLVNDDWMETLENMGIGDVFDADDLSLHEHKDGIERSLERMTDYLNCDDIVPLAVEIFIEGNNYYLVVDVACYNGKWFCCNQMGLLGFFFDNTLANGELIPN